MQRNEDIIHLGSTRNVLDGAKAMLAKLEYTPYGQEYQFGGNVPVPRYTGHHWDAETGMYFAPFRYYMPGSGRWLSRDPLGFVDGLNIFAYAKKNPIQNRDALGLHITSTWRNPTDTYYPGRRDQTSVSCVGRVVSALKEYGKNNDKQNHCLVSCMLARDCALGPKLTWIIGRAKEILDRFPYGSEDSREDNIANDAGIKCGRGEACKDDDGRSCAACCRRAGYK